MKTKGLVLAVMLLSISLLGCLYQLVNMGIENDGLRQVVSSQRESISVLLDYSAIATRCDVGAEEIVTRLKVHHPVIHFQQSTNTIKGLAFSLEFKGGHPSVIEVTENRQVNLCRK